MGLPWPTRVSGRFAWTILLAATFFSGASSEKDNIVKLTKFNFENNVRRGAWFVKFYAPWCTHCQRLAPIWEKLADQAIAKDWPVRIAEVDCTSSKDVCEKAQVKAYPTLALISNGMLKGKYMGEASVSHFEEWLGSQQVMKASEGETIDMTGDSRPKTTASHATAASAVINNLLARFPTKSKILNIYFYGGISIAGLVAGLCMLFKLVDAEEDAAEDEHDKEG
mmetsp:Transcript_50359/g.155685  ORF Transcript_50359/g.155685 Transcript_50359/m.155685 type:complete len:224 (+) Transcript_50359:52-723(+)